MQKSVLITGCSAGGLGDALAQELHRRGLRVFATGRNLARLEHLTSIGITTLELDIANEASILEVVKKVRDSTQGRLDILVNNAGTGYGAPLIESDLTTSRAMFDVNLFARAALTRACLALLIEAKGAVVNIGSIAGIYPGIWQGMYSASCAAQHMWNDVLRIELEPFDVRVVLVVTGAVTTKFLENKSGCQVANDSMYFAAKKPIEAYMDGSAVSKNFTDAHEWARQVANNLLRQTPKSRFWVGGMVNVVWFVSTMFWHTIWDKLLVGGTGLNELRRAVRRR